MYNHIRYNRLYIERGIIRWNIKTARWRKNCSNCDAFEVTIEKSQSKNITGYLMIGLVLFFIVGTIFQLELKTKRIKKVVLY